MCVPIPAVAGLKLPDETPVPEYVPDAGDPPVKVTGELYTHTVLRADCVTVGKAFTVTTVGAEVAEQPDPSVYVTV